MCYEYLPGPRAKQGFYHTPASQDHNLVLHLPLKCKNFLNFSQSRKTLLHEGRALHPTLCQALIPVRNKSAFGFFYDANVVRSVVNQKKFPFFKQV